MCGISKYVYNKSKSVVQECVLYKNVYYTSNLARPKTHNIIYVNSVTNSH